MFDRLIFGAVAAACLASGAVIAQTAPPPPLGNLGGHGGMMRMTDTNNDGVLSREEMLAAAIQRFSEADANNDGKVTKDEMRAAGDKRRNEMRARFSGREGGRRWGNGPGGPGGRDRAGGPGGMLARLDTNKDGALSKAEFDVPFARMDTNKDGQIDKSEMQTARTVLRPRRDMNGWGGPANVQAPTNPGN